MTADLLQVLIINLVKISFLGKMICKSDIWPRMIKYGLYRTYLSEPLYDTYLTPCMVRISHYRFYRCSGVSNAD